MADKRLERLYFDPSKPGSYGGLKSFKSSLPLRLKKKADSWLKDQPVYNLHRPVRRKFKRGKVITAGIDQQWQADLVDLSNISSSNKGNKFLLTVIDCFSRYAWARTLKNKKGESVRDALESIFAEGRVPKYLHTDQGREFRNAFVQNLLKKHKVRYFTTYNDDIKASIVERWNRTILSKMFRYFTKNNTRSYINILQDLIDSYNDTAHSTTGIQPSKVSAENQESVWLKSFNKPVVYKKPLHKVGSYVRISKSRKTFDKGYLPRWSTELFLIKKINNTLPVTYELVDLDQEDIVGIFYEQELIAAKPAEFDEVERILDTKKSRGGVTRYLVKWKGYPSKFNSWTTDIKLI